MHMTVNNSLPRCVPEQQGVASSGVLSFLEEIEQRKLELHGFMLLRHGYVLAEGWWKPYQPEVPQAVYSLTKSFTSLAVGFAVQEGRLALDDEVLDYFPEIAISEIRGNIGSMNIKHLLTMTTGHETDTARFGVSREFLQHITEASVGDRTDHDYIRAFMEQPVTKTHGTHFLYNSGASHVLGEIVERVTGSRLIDYLQPRLFAPLGIRQPSWGEAPGGGNTGGWGLKLCTEDLARFGQFLLNKGEWNGQRLIAPEWIEQATSGQVNNEPVEAPEGEPINPDWIQGYGYQFWRCRHHAFRGDGAFGQYCIVLPDQDAVIAMNGGLQDMQGVMDVVWRHLLPSMTSTGATSELGEYERLIKKLSSLELGEQGSAVSPAWDSNHRCYLIQDNEQGLQKISFTFMEHGCQFAWLDPGGRHQLLVGTDTWNSDQVGVQQVSVRGVWLDSGQYEIYIYPSDTPHYDRLVFEFQADRVTIHHEHLSFTTLNHEFTGIEER